MANLCTNPGFETADDWALNTFSVIGTVTAARDATVSHSGTYSLKFQSAGNAQDRAEWMNNNNAPSVGTKIRYGVWIKVQGSEYPGGDPNTGGPGGTMLWLNLLPKDSIGGDVGGAVAGTQVYVKTIDWTYIPIGDYVVGPGVSYLSFRLGIDARSDPNTPKTIVWFDDVESEIITWNATGGNQLRSTTQGIFRNDATAKVWTENQCASVLLDDDISASVPDPVEPVNIVAIKGERQAFQVVVQPLDADWTTVNITNDAFSGLSPTITVKRPRFVTLPTKSPSFLYIRSDVVPDPMPIEVDVTLTQNNSNPFMVEIDIPANATPGTYTTNFYVMKGVTSMATIPVSVEVKNVTLPAIPTFWNIGNQNNATTGSIYHYEDPLNVKDRPDILKRYLDNFKVNRLNPGSYAWGLEYYSSTWNGSQCVLDTSAEAAEVWAYMASIGIDDWPPRGNFGSGGLGLGATEFTDADQDTLTAEFMTRAADCIDKVMAARDAQGAGPFMWQRVDETSAGVPWDTAVQTGLVTERNWVATQDSRIKYNAMMEPVMSLTDVFDSIVGTDNYAAMFMAEYAAMFAAGGKPGNYPNGWNSGLANAGQVGMYPEAFRLIVWAYWFWNWRAIGWWTIGAWYESGVEHDPWGTEGADGIYTGSDWFYGINLIYPPRDPSLENGPIDSIRYSALREGLEDVELFQMLQDLIDAESGTVEQRATAQAALDAANALATHPPIGSCGWADEFGVHDLGAIETAREAVIDSILALGMTPGTTLSIHIGGPDTISIL